jgi:low temperature requirement protein LtrA
MIEPIITQRLSSGVDWRVASTAHFTERHGLIVILAIGESIIAIGAGVAQEPMSLPILLGVGASLVLAAGLWWAYFHRLAAQAERALLQLTDAARATTARDAYTYVSLLIVSGVVFAALGIEESLAHVGSGEPAGWFNAAALGGGIAWYLGATVLFARRVTGRTRRVRGAGALVIACAIPLLAFVAPLVALSGSACLLIIVLTADAYSRSNSFG